MILTLCDTVPILFDLQSGRLLYNRRLECGNNSHSAVPPQSCFGYIEDHSYQTSEYDTTYVNHCTHVYTFNIVRKSMSNGSFRVTSVNVKPAMNSLRFRTVL